MLPEPVMAFLTDAAKQARTTLPDRDGSLFVAGVLDSFSLVEFVTLIESQCGITVDDAELRPERFETMAKVETLIQAMNR